MNIYELIRGRRHYLPEGRLKDYMYQLLKSMDHMHRNGIFHRDIKPENILVLDDELKLADFGSCRGIYSKQPYTEYISTRWCAPRHRIGTAPHGHCRGDAEAMQRRCRGDAEAMQRRCRGDAEAMQRRCRGDAEAMQRRCSSTEAMQRRCRGAALRTPCILRSASAPHAYAHAYASDIPRAPEATPLSTLAPPLGTARLSAC